MTKRRYAGWLVGLLIAVLALDAGAALAFQAGDTVEGAVWRMVMTSRARKNTRRGTAFRVNNGVLYQRKERKRDAEEEVVGKDRQEGKTTILDFENLKVRNPDAPRAPAETMSGTARVTFESGGKWSGQFVDGDGLHWDVRLTRFKE